MESTLNPADLWYPLPRALPGETLESGSESMKRFFWLIPICLAIVAAVLGLKSWQSHSRNSQQRSIQPRLTFEPDYARCEPRPDANVWCSPPQRTGAEA